MIPNLQELEPVAKQILRENKVERDFDTTPAIIVAFRLGYLPLKESILVESIEPKTSTVEV